MKKSNKILLGGFLTLLLIFAAIHIALYAKYKRGDVALYNAEDDLAQLSMQQFPNILFVSLRNVPNATVSLSNVAKVAKGDQAGVEYVQKGDTLLITGKAQASQDDFRSVTFQLPYNATLSASNSSLSFVPGNKKLQGNPVIYLKGSQAQFSGRENPLHFTHLKMIVSDNSAALFQGDIQINSLDVQLSNASFEMTEGNVDQLSIASDSASRISLPSKHLLKATIRVINPG